MQIGLDAECGRVELVEQLRHFAWFAETLQSVTLEDRFALIVGFGLSVAGVTFQGLLRNPLADPYILGVSGGASFAALLGMSAGAAAAMLPALAWAGALHADLERCLRHAGEVKSGEQVTARLGKGQLLCTVDEVNADA